MKFDWFIMILNAKLTLLYIFLDISLIIIVRFEKKNKNRDAQWSRLYTLHRVARRYLRASPAKGLKDKMVWTEAP